MGRDWAPVAKPVAGHTFFARRVDGENLGGFNPFLEIAKTLANPTTYMALQNVVVVGATFADGPGFIVLTDRGPPVPIGGGGGEDVQDHTCAIAKGVQP